MRTRLAHFVPPTLLVAGVFGFLPACGAETRGKAPATAPSQTEGPPATYVAPPPAGAPAEMARDQAAPADQAPPMAAPATPPGAFHREAPGAADPHSTASAGVRLVEARRELDIATNERDCARACRALESMERAARQVCELARSPEERKECVSAGEQVDKARARVQNACGGCAQKLR